MKIYDCFKFNGEWDILNIRLNTHSDAVDYFVIAEGNYTQVGNPKTFQFNFQNPILQPFLSKIRYLPVTDMPNTSNPWDNEVFLRNALKRGLWDAQDTDWILISDCDEILRNQVIQSLRLLSCNSVGFSQQLCYCFFNNKRVQPAINDIWSAAARFQYVNQLGLQAFRFSTYDHVIADAGWHYSYMMHKQDIVHKLQNAADTWVNVPRLIDTLDPEASAQHGKDLLGRTQIRWQLEDENTADLPSFVRTNRHLFDAYFLKSDPEFDRPPPEYIMHYAEHVQGWFGGPDFEFYRWCVAQVPSYAHFVEVGSFKGRSSAFMAVEIINSGKQIDFDCVDTWQGSEEHQAGAISEDPDVVAGSLFEQFVKNMSPVAHKYKALRLASLEAATTYEDHSLDLVFLDAAHDFDNVKADILAWWPKIKSGGIISGHDWCHIPIVQAVTICLGLVNTMGNCWYLIKP
jgi:beta-1,4-mannosyl-glycoprotein beta-1,4-N-acetylglucosaminyltransferase